MSELEYEREFVQQVLQEMNVNPILFEIFPAFSQSPHEAYLEEVKNCDIFVMILWTSLCSAVLEEYYEALKRNKPILVLIKTLAGNEERAIELKNFLANLTGAVPNQLVCRSVYREFRKIAELKNAVRDSVISEITKFYKEPIHTLSREEMYDLGISIIRYAQKRLCLFQRTPSLFLGPRNYLSENKFFYEKDFFDSLKLWIDQHHISADKEFLYLFSLDAMKEELIKNDLKNNHSYINHLKERIKYYKDIEIQSSYRFRFVMINISISGPLIVGDNRYAMWLLGGEDAVSISQENEKICDLLVRMLKTHCQEHVTDEKMISLLDL